MSKNIISFAIPEEVFSLPPEVMARSIERRSAYAFKKAKRANMAHRIAATMTVFTIMVLTIVNFGTVTYAPEYEVSNLTTAMDATVGTATTSVSTIARSTEFAKRNGAPIWVLDMSAQKMFAAAVEGVAGNQPAEVKKAVAVCIRTASEDYSLPLEMVLEQFHYPMADSYTDETMSIVGEVVNGNVDSVFLTSRPVYCYNETVEPSNWVSTQSYVGTLGGLKFYTETIKD